MTSETTTTLDGADDGIHNITQLRLACPDYTFSRKSIPKSGTVVKVQDLVFLMAAIGDRLLKGKDLGPKEPSITTLTKANAAHRVQVIRPERSKSPNLFLTREMLDCEVDITPELHVWLSDFAKKPIPSQIDENSITTEVLHPLLFLWLMIWSDAFELENGDRDWGVRSLVPSGGGGDIDILVIRGLEGVNSSVEVAAIKAKTPRSCGHADILNFGTSGDAKDDAFARQCTRHLMRCDESMRANATTWWPRSPTLGAFVVYPSHFFPVAYQGDTNRSVICADATETKDKWPETKEKLENHMKAVSVLAAWAFTLVIASGGDRKERWGGVCQKQVDQAVQWTTTAGEQLASPNRLIAALTGCWAAVSTLIYQAVFTLSVALVPLERLKALALPNGDEIVVQSALYIWRLPFNLTLPPPDAFHQSHTAQTFVFSWPNIVVKLYDNVEPYAHELAFYEKWSSVLGSAIPTLRAKGRRIDDKKPFLIFSNEGEPITDLTEDDRSIVQRSVLDVIHGEGWHHHDLAARNVLRTPSGHLCLIDFGMASKCDREGCDEYWE